VQKPVFRSPVMQAQLLANPVVGIVNGTETAIRFADAATEKQRQSVLSICDVSCLPRLGVKGPNAAAWLTSSNLTVAATANSWAVQDNQAIVLRLGNSEFLVEDQQSSTLVEQLNETKVNEHGVHKVLRSDASFVLSGELLPKLFAEVCAIELDKHALENHHLVMTVIAGVSATVLRQELNGQPVYRIWCDGTFGPYLWNTLLTIIEEHGGGPVGLDLYFKES